MFWQGCIELVLTIDRKFIMKNFGKGLEQSQLFKRGLLLIVADNALTCTCTFKSIWLYIYLDREHLDLTTENVQSAINSYRLRMAAGIMKNKIDFESLFSLTQCSWMKRTVSSRAVSESLQQCRWYSTRVRVFPPEDANCYAPDSNKSTQR